MRRILEEGFAAATAKHVAERAGVTRGVIQYHFGDRNGLLMAVVDDGVAISELGLRHRVEVIVDTAWRCYSSPTSLAADPADAGVAEMIWAPLRGVVLAQMSIGMTFDWQVARRALIAMASHYLHR